VNPVESDKASIVSKEVYMYKVFLIFVIAGQRTYQVEVLFRIWGECPEISLPG